MTTEPQPAPSRSEVSPWHPLLRKDVLSGLLFAVIALLGLWLSRDYPIGTALRMGTGYVPRLLCWILLGLGVVILVQGLREAQTARTLSVGDALTRLCSTRWAIPSSTSTPSSSLGPHTTSAASSSQPPANTESRAKRRRIGGPSRS